MMSCRRKYLQLVDCKPDDVVFTLSPERNAKPSLSMTDINFVTPPLLTMWPRCTGDGNFGTMYGPTDITKAKFNLDLTDCSYKGSLDEFSQLEKVMTAIDDKLFEFVFQNQLRILSRKNLQKEEIKMLQIRSVHPKYDKNTGTLIGHSVNLSTSKYAWDGMGGRVERKIHITDHTGTVIEDGKVGQGDVVRSTVYPQQVYTGVGGDKFGIQWGFEDVCIVAQRGPLEKKSEVDSFMNQTYTFSTPYTHVWHAPPFDSSDQFSD